MGGQTVPGAFATVDGPANAMAEELVMSTGMLANVLEGTHSVALADKTSGSPVARGSSGDVRVVALAVGG